MNEIIKSMETRRSVRSYKPDMIPQEIIDRICEAGTYAASGMGKQHREKRLYLSYITVLDHSTISDTIHKARQKYSLLW